MDLRGATRRWTYQGRLLGLAESHNTVPARGVKQDFAFPHKVTQALLGGSSLTSTWVRLAATRPHLVRAAADRARYREPRPSLDARAADEGARSTTLLRRARERPS